jgi:hypothetical protein
MSTLSCDSEPRRIASFYYWKSVFKLSNQEKQSLESLKTNRIYIKYFDVKWDATSQKAIPAAKIVFKDDIPKSIQIVPVVFIANQTLQKTPMSGVEQLGQNVSNLIVQINDSQQLKPSEIQIDCDWSASTQSKYFLLLKALKNKKIVRLISCTIRLHQVKYPEQTGMPPVDKGVLMFYNMGQLGDRNANSIYDYATAQRYVRSVRHYPLKLDVALPIFSWAIHYQNQKIKHLISKPDLRIFKDTATFTKIDGFSYKVKKGQYIGGYYFKEHDEVKIEAISPDLCQQAAKQVAKHLKTPPENIIFYDLDSYNFTHFDNEKINQICAYFR